MKKVLLLLFAFVPFLNYAAEQGVDEKIDKVFGDATGWFVQGIFYAIPFTDKIAVPWVLIVLIGGALFFTFYFKLINFTGFKTAINIVRGKYDEIESGGDDHVETSDAVFTVDGDNPDTIRVEQDADHHGEVTHFQALTAALSATVGLGNIAGVAVALSIGGPGATFWMIIAGFIGMASKFTECTLGVKYREIDENGKVYGGPMYYLKKGLRDRGLAKLGKGLAIIFAIMCIGGSFGGGNMFQSNQAFAMLESYGSSDADEYENLEETIDSKVKYSYFETNEGIVSSVNEDSVIYMMGDTRCALTKDDFLGDSIVMAGSWAAIDTTTDLAALSGALIACTSYEKIISNVESISGGYVN